MTILATPRDIRSPQNGRVPAVDSPAAPARAGARVPVTKSEIKKGDRVSRAGRRWWALASRPLSIAALWRLSGVDRKRTPLDHLALRLIWQVSNWTDRLVMFALIAVAPTALTGPLRWVAVRPTRRYGLYLVVGGLTAAYLIGRK